MSQFSGNKKDSEWKFLKILYIHKIHKRTKSNKILLSGEFSYPPTKLETNILKQEWSEFSLYHIKIEIMQRKSLCYKFQEIKKILRENSLKKIHCIHKKSTNYMITSGHTIIEIASVLMREFVVFEQFIIVLKSVPSTIFLVHGTSTTEIISVY